MKSHINAPRGQRTIQFAVIVICSLLAKSVGGALPSRAVASTLKPAILTKAPVGSNNELMYDAKPQAAKPPVKFAGLSVTPRSHVVWMEVTAYCACKKCCGPNAKGITASGRTVRFNGGKFVAADTDVLPFGSKIKIPGYNNGKAVEVTDTGSAIVGNHLDVFFPSHKVAQQWGHRYMAVTVLD